MITTRDKPRLYVRGNENSSLESAYFDRSYPYPAGPCYNVGSASGESIPHWV